MSRAGTTYYSDGLLRQPSAQLSRNYLGIENLTVPPLPPPSTIEWPQSVSKSADQFVVSTATPQNDDELFIPIVANAFYMVELLLLYAGNSAQGDYRARFSFPSIANGGTAMGFIVAFNANLLPEINAVQKGTNTNFPTNDIVIGVTSSISDLLCAQCRFQIRTVLPGIMQYEFANGNGADGRTVVTKKGSILRAQRLV